MTTILDLTVLTVSTIIIIICTVTDWCIPIYTPTATSIITIICHTWINCSSSSSSSSSGGRCCSRSGGSRICF